MALARVALRRICPMAAHARPDRNARRRTASTATAVIRHVRACVTRVQQPKKAKAPTERVDPSSTTRIPMTNVSAADATAQAAAASTMGSVVTPTRNVCRRIASMDSAATTIVAERVTPARRRKKAVDTTVYADSLLVIRTQTMNAQGCAMALAFAPHPRV